MTNSNISLDKLKAQAIAFADAWAVAFVEATAQYERINKLANRLFKIIECRYCGRKPRKYYRTGIEPKWRNRTRKKQRLTRLQRRHKRQRR